MSTKPANPYQPPATASQLIRSETASQPRIPLVLVLLGTAAYHVFVLLLFTSGNSDDLKAGFLFILNTPVLILWVFGLFRRLPRSFVVGIVAAGMQIVINGVMIVAGIGDIGIVCAINLTIMAGMIVVAAICWRLTQADPG